MNDSTKHADSTHTHPEVIEDVASDGATAEERAEARIDRVLEKWHRPEPQALDSVDDDDDDNPILNELWRVREEQSKKYGHDMKRRMADTRRMTFLFGNDVVRRSPSGELEVIFMGLGGIRTDFDDTTLAEFSRGNKPRSI